MNSIHYDIMRRGGVAATFELLADGHTSHQLTQAVRRNEVIRARQGHYVTPQLDQAELRAVRVGGRLTGASAARRLGIWTPPGSKFQVRTDAHARALRSPINSGRRLRGPEARVRWRPSRRQGTRSLVSAIDALEDIIATESPRMAFACLESALYRGIIRPREATAILARIPAAKQKALGTPAGESESGSESLMSFDLSRAGIGFCQQFKIKGIGRVDFLIGRKLIVEIDSVEFHVTAKSFEDDRNRDALLSILGFRVLRFSYQQLTLNRGLVIRAIIAAIARGDCS